MNSHYRHIQDMRSQERHLDLQDGDTYYIKFDGEWLIGQWVEEEQAWVSFERLDDGSTTLESSIDLDAIGERVPSRDELVELLTQNQPLHRHEPSDHPAMKEPHMTTAFLIDNPWYYHTTIRRTDDVVDRPPLDWRLGEIKNGTNKDRMAYPMESVYYFAALLDNLFNADWDNDAIPIEVESQVNAPSLQAFEDAFAPDDVLVGITLAFQGDWGEIRPQIRPAQPKRTDDFNGTRPLPPVIVTKRSSDPMDIDALRVLRREVDWYLNHHGHLTRGSGVVVNPQTHDVQEYDTPERLTADLKKVLTLIGPSVGGTITFGQTLIVTYVPKVYVNDADLPTPCSELTNIWKLNA